jgi:hypothetical protein
MNKNYFMDNDMDYMIEQAIEELENEVNTMLLNQIETFNYIDKHLICIEKTIKDNHMQVEEVPIYIDICIMMANIEFGEIEYDVSIGEDLLNKVRDIFKLLNLCDMV